MKIDNLYSTLLEAPLPDDWDKNMFSNATPYSKMIAYAKERAEQVGKGLSRVAFLVTYQGRKTVIKVALNAKGLSQNEEEVRLFSDWYLSGIGITIPMIDHDEKNRRPTWIHTEFADKITDAKLTKYFSGVKLPVVIANIEYEKSGRRTYLTQELPEAIHDNENYDKLRDLILNFTDISTGDLQRKANWGIYKGNPVILDLGLTKDTEKLYR
ncbi:hypothetical protein [Alishewanella phage vB_AspM_Slickus01]|nr:hypothetical protein [Alishewanella phage vB_AspM_Slickus01]